jgi:voltage-gated potassium channel
MSSMSPRRRIETVIFGADTPAGRVFDVVLLWAILLSVLLAVSESVMSIREQYGTLLRTLEWILTGLFTVEYALRIYSARQRLRYITSFFGVIDLLAIVPSFLNLFIAGPQYFLVLRSLRFLRVFRVFKLSRYVGEANVLAHALRASREKITVFVVVVLTLVLIIGSAMYLIEGPANGFVDIPVSIYWAVVTLTTVGYGDITPRTAVGQFLSAGVMILGYAIIAVPTGIVTTELSRAMLDQRDQRTRRSVPCPNCGLAQHEPDAVYCRNCGTELP